MKQVDGPGQLIDEMRVSQAQDPKGIEADAFTVGNRRRTIFSTADKFTQVCTASRSYDSAST
jgi:hypothetical protein